MFLITFILTCTGAAWLSAVRVVKCFVNSFNGRNLQLYLTLNKAILI